jgi:hypothetical protein
VDRRPRRAATNYEPAARDAPRAKRARESSLHPPSPALQNAAQYFEKDCLREDQKVEDGFYDPGRRGVGFEALPDLSDLRVQKLPPDIFKSGGREVILFDRHEDEQLRVFSEAISR